MNKPVYTVHLHRIEDSYCFGTFNSVDNLEKALKEYFKDNKSNPWKDKYLEYISQMKEGEELTITVENIDWTWNIYVCILYQKMDTFYTDRVNWILC